MDTKKQVEQTKMQLMAHATAVAHQAMDAMRADEEQLHSMGYHQYAAAANNMSFRIEKAMHELIDKLGEMP